MPLVESGADGRSPGSFPCSAISSSGKEKKNQAREERDRLKQAEKKKRRLEKALATAAAIRIELEKKKQRRKEEEERLDDEGAALAESVALRVLVDEDTDAAARFGVPKNVERYTSGNAAKGLRVVLEEDADRAGLFVVPKSIERKAYDRDVGRSVTAGNEAEEIGFVGPCLGVRRRDNVENNGLKRHGSFKYAVGGEESHRGTYESDMEWNGCDWDEGEQGAVSSGREDTGGEGELVEGEEGGSWEVLSTAEEKARSSNERARAAEMAAGLAAAQAVAALRIAEEARAEAEAAKKAAEAAMNEAIHRRETQLKAEFLDEGTTQPMSVERERDDLKAQLEKTEQKLKKKTLRVSELEHNLAEVTQYFLEFKAMIEASKEKVQTCDHSIEKGQGFECGHITSAESLDRTED